MRSLALWLGFGLGCLTSAWAGACRSSHCPDAAPLGDFEIVEGGESLVGGSVTVSSDGEEYSVVIHYQEDGSDVRVEF
jgi:hypothetical protein